MPSIFSSRFVFVCDFSHHFLNHLEPEKHVEYQQLTLDAKQAICDIWYLGKLSA
ncbi:MAG: hypothetical protein ACREPR_25010 [Brasilonema sp.]